MQRIMVVCGAGASSTFLVHWMRQVARANGSDVAVRAVSLGEIDAALIDADVLLVGHHLAAEFSALDALASTAGVRAAILPALTFDAAGAAIALTAAGLDLPLATPSTSLTADPPRERETTHG